ncbi:transcription termination/antitermination protein NusA [Mesomycoplasma dispar]|uniref:Transcription termination/antitermination protein NusA n=1 Tax=Mesomycoplasma dispar TaxID=86660 RepID=A0ABN5DUI2_9BACT|nr:transcription termination/antitermination protein NusA [Mesomycoplasma dispar]ATP59820.1 transcription termination/antitermination protein NusA [Mesomycoplasma dispar]
MTKKKRNENPKINPKDSIKLIVQSIKEVAKNSELTLETVIEIFRQAIEFVINKKIDPDAQIQIEADIEKSVFKVYNTNGIVVEDSYFEELTNEEKVSEAVSFILLSNAKEVNPNVQVDDIFTIEINLETFEQWLFTAIMHSFKQKISELVRNNIYDKYLALKNQVVLATITNKISAGYIFEIDDDKVAAFMPSHYAIGHNNMKIGTKHEVVIENVTKNIRQSQVIVSSKSVQLVKKKIIDAIPELQSNFLEITSIARVPGEKCKVAVRKTDDSEASDISEIGSIVGETGSRVFAISQELDGEKIEVIKHDDNIIQFIVNAMAPARVICVKEFRINHKLRRFTVVVPDFQHSLAIGKNGSNVKLAADLTRSLLQILPYSAILKDENFQIEWNGNIKDQQELTEIKNEYMQRQQNRIYQSQRNYYSHNSDSFDSILQEFESDIRELEKPYGVEREFIPRNQQKPQRTEKPERSEQREVAQTRKNPSPSSSKSRFAAKNLAKRDNNSGYYNNNYNSDSEDGSNSYQNVSQKAFFDADSLFNSALNEAINENELIDKKHKEEEESKKQEQRREQQNNNFQANSSRNYQANRPPKTSPNFDPDKKEEAYIQNERQIRNFKSDDDLVKYTGVGDIDIDDFDF